MRHFILLLLVFITVYLFWRAASKRERRQGIKTARSGWPIAVAVLVLTLGLVAAFFLNGVKIL